MYLSSPNGERPLPKEERVDHRCASVERTGMYWGLGVSMKLWECIHAHTSCKKAVLSSTEVEETLDTESSRSVDSIRFSSCRRITENLVIAISTLASGEIG